MRNKEDISQWANNTEFADGQLFNICVSSVEQSIVADGLENKSKDKSNY